MGTAEQVVVLTHLWWTAQGPQEDPYAPDPEALRTQRERMLPATAERDPVSFHHTRSHGT